MLELIPTLLLAIALAGQLLVAVVAIDIKRGADQLEADMRRVIGHHRQRAARHRRHPAVRPEWVA